jgi:hypothetical protein
VPFTRLRGNPMGRMIRFSRVRLWLLVVVVGGVLLTLPVGSSGATAGTLDQSQTNASGGVEALIGPSELMAQTFTAGITGQLDQVDLLLDRTGSPGSLIVEIRTVSEGLPTSTVLASATVDSSQPYISRHWQR